MRPVVDYCRGDLEAQVGRRSKPDEDAVKVHVTPNGGRYVNLGELLCSKGARKLMAKMDRVLRDERIGQQDTGSLAPGPKSASRKR